MSSAAVAASTTAMEATSSSVKGATATLETAPATVEGANATMVTAPTPVAIPSSAVMPTPSVTTPETPTAANPNPTVIPTPITRRPIVIGAWGHRNHFLRHQRWGLVLRRHARDHGLRRRLAVGIRSRRILTAQRTVVGQHCHDNRRGDSAFLETQNRVG